MMLYGFIHTMPLATKQITAESAERPSIGAATALEFDYGEATGHKDPSDPLSIGNVAMPTSTEGRKLKRQRLETVPTMEGLESYIRQKIPDASDPEFEGKMQAALGKDYALTDAEGKGQSDGKASVAATTIGSLRRTVHQMLNMSATAAKGVTETGADAKAVGVFEEKFPKTSQRGNVVPIYPHAVCADVPQNLELITCELVANNNSQEDWTIPPMTPVFYHKDPKNTAHPAIYGQYIHDSEEINGRFAGVALHDGLQAWKCTKEHASRRSIAIAVGGVVNLSCDKLTAAQFQFGDYVWISNGDKGRYAEMEDNRSRRVPKYFTYKSGGKTHTKIGRVVGHISKKHGGLRIVLCRGEWEAV